MEAVPFDVVSKLDQRPVDGEGKAVVIARGANPVSRGRLMPYLPATRAGVWILCRNPLENFLGIPTASADQC